MLKLNKVHHIAIICSDYERSKAFYTRQLGLTILNEQYRADRNSFKLDLGLCAEYVIELFSFPDPPKRATMPEACGLRHLAFEVDDVEDTVAMLNEKMITAEPVRIDDVSGKKFTFIRDPDDLPIEFYEK